MCCFVRCILYTGQCPPQGTSLEVSLPPYLPSFHAPPLLLSLAPSLLPSSARFLPPLFPSLRPFISSFLTRSIPQPFFHSRSHPPSHHCFLPPPPSPCFLLPILHPSLPGCLPPSNSLYTVCVFGKLHCCTVLCSAMRDTETMGSSCQKKVSFQWPAVTFSERAPTTNPFFTKSNKCDVRHVQRIRQKHGRRSYLSVGIC